MLAYLSPTSFFLLILPPPRSTLFPYTTLFRSFSETLSIAAEFLKGSRVSTADPSDGFTYFLGSLQVGYIPAASRGSTDRKSTRLNSSHVAISYAVFCLKKKKKKIIRQKLKIKQ